MKTIISFLLLIVILGCNANTHPISLNLNKSLALDSIIFYTYNKNNELFIKHLTTINYSDEGEIEQIRNSYDHLEGDGWHLSDTQYPIFIDSKLSTFKTKSTDESFSSFYEFDTSGYIIRYEQHTNNNKDTILTDVNYNSNKILSITSWSKSLKNGIIQDFKTDYEYIPSNSSILKIKKTKGVIDTVRIKFDSLGRITNKYQNYVYYNIYYCKHGISKINQISIMLTPDTTRIKFDYDSLGRLIYQSRINKRGSSFNTYNYNNVGALKNSIHSSHTETYSGYFKYD